jgi:UDP-N-acetylmuramoyl-L-alanyl-D-glutamate--2,6-diaminopimelate ligase
LVIVDYSHTPDALDSALRALKKHSTADLWCVFGCGGDRDKGKRPLMGAVAEALADRVVVTSDNPRSENPEVIIEQILAGMDCVANVVVEADREKAIYFAVESAKSNDVLLLAGKGHEDYQEVKGERIYFSDVECARQALSQRVLI